MWKHSIDPSTLEQDAAQRRDHEATVEEAETLRRHVTFSHTRIQMSRARLRAEAFLQRN